MAERDTNYFRGEWNAERAAGTEADPLGVTGTYRQRELVTHDGHLWINLQDSGDDDSTNNTDMPGASGVTTWENLGSTAEFEDTVLNLDTMGNVTIDPDVVSSTATLAQRQEAVRTAIGAASAADLPADFPAESAAIDLATATSITFPARDYLLINQAGGGIGSIFNLSTTDVVITFTAAENTPMLRGVRLRNETAADPSLLLVTANPVDPSDGLILRNGLLGVNRSEFTGRYNHLLAYQPDDTFLITRVSTRTIAFFQNVSGTVAPAGAFPREAIRFVNSFDANVMRQEGELVAIATVNQGTTTTRVWARDIGAGASSSNPTDPTSTGWTELTLTDNIFAEDRFDVDVNDVFGLTEASATGGQSIRRNSGDTAWEYYTPGGGATGGITETQADERYVQYNEATSLTEAQQNQAQINIGISNNSDLETELNHIPTAHNFNYTAISGFNIASGPGAIGYANLGGPQARILFTTDPSALFSTGDEVFLWDPVPANFTDAGEATYHLVVQREPTELRANEWVVYFSVNRGTRTTAALTAAVANGFYSRVPLGSAVNELVQTVSGGTTSYEWMTRSTGGVGGGSTTYTITYAGQFFTAPPADIDPNTGDTIVLAGSGSDPTFAYIVEAVEGLLIRANGNVEVPSGNTAFTLTSANALTQMQTLLSNIGVRVDNDGLLVEADEPFTFGYTDDDTPYVGTDNRILLYGDAIASNIPGGGTIDQTNILDWTHPDFTVTTGTALIQAKLRITSANPGVARIYIAATDPTPGEDINSNANTPTERTRVLDALISARTTIIDSLMGDVTADTPVIVEASSSTFERTVQFTTTQTALGTDLTSPEFISAWFEVPVARSFGRRNKIIPVGTAQEVGTGDDILGAQNLLTLNFRRNTAAVGTASIQDQSATFDKIAAGAGLIESGDHVVVNIDTSTLDFNGGAIEVKEEGITTNRIADLNVTHSKLADNAVTNRNVGDRAIQTDNIDYHTIIRSNLSFDLQAQIDARSDITVTETMGQVETGTVIRPTNLTGESDWEMHILPDGSRTITFTEVDAPDINLGDRFSLTAGTTIAPTGTVETNAVLRTAPIIVPEVRTLTGNLATGPGTGEITLSGIEIDGVTPTTDNAFTIAAGTALLAGRHITFVNIEVTVDSASFTLTSTQHSDNAAPLTNGTAITPLTEEHDVTRIELALVAGSMVGTQIYLNILIYLLLLHLKVEMVYIHSHQKVHTISVELLFILLKMIV